MGSRRPCTRGADVSMSAAVPSLEARESAVAPVSITTEGKLT